MNSMRGGASSSNVEHSLHKTNQNWSKEKHMYRFLLFVGEGSNDEANFHLLDVHPLHSVPF